MPYYLQVDDRQKLKAILRCQACAECGGELEAFYDLAKHLPYIQCKANRSHEGIMREASQYEQQGITGMNILARREIMTTELGEEKGRALQKYEGVLNLTRSQAAEIIEKIWPEAPPEEKGRAMLLCVTQQLNPLMKHVYLITFNKGKPNQSWATVISIQAKRLMASRRGTFSYVDDTPRVMTADEQVRIFGEVMLNDLVTIVKLRDPRTGAEAVGYGSWPKSETPYGVDKGNSKFNMSAIRGESTAISRLRPGDMPENVMVLDENVAKLASEQGVADVAQIAGKGGIIDIKSEVVSGPETVAGPNPVVTKKQAEAPETNLGTLLTWLQTHGKSYTRDWLFKNQSFQESELMPLTPEGLKNRQSAIAEIRQMAGWSD
jgi:hypothetical protein